jgi:Tfp pilus assembly protein PilZ
VRLVASDRSRTVVAAESVNLSEGGMYVRAPVALAVGSQVQCEISLLGRNLALPGYVAWNEAAEALSPARAVGDAVTGGPAAPRQRLATQPLRRDPGDRAREGQGEGAGMGIRFGSLPPDHAAALRSLVQASQSENPTTRVWFPGVAQPVRMAGAGTSAEPCLEAALPFLAVGSLLRVQPPDQAQASDAYIEGISVVVDAGDPVPRLRIHLARLSEIRVRSATDETQPYAALEQVVKGVSVPAPAAGEARPTASETWKYAPPQAGTHPQAAGEGVKLRIDQADLEAQARRARRARGKRWAGAVLGVGVAGAAWAAWQGDLAELLPIAAIVGERAMPAVGPAEGAPALEALPEAPPSAEGQAAPELAVAEDPREATAAALAAQDPSDDPVEAPPGADEAASAAAGPGEVEGVGATPTVAATRPEIEVTPELTRVRVRLDGTAQDLRSYDLSSPGVAVSFSGARPAIPHANYGVHQGLVSRVWVRDEGGEAQVRVLFRRRAVRYALQVEDRALVVDVMP